MRTHSPTKHLRDIPIGQPVKLLGVERVLIVNQVRDDGYIDLHNKAGLLSVTASPGHEIEEIK
jgi:hypothetical protein